MPGESWGLGPLRSPFRMMHVQSNTQRLRVGACRSYTFASPSMHIDVQIRGKPQSHEPMLAGWPMATLVHLALHEVRLLRS